MVKMYLDSLSTSKKAIFLYFKAGFVETERYNQNDYSLECNSNIVNEAFKDKEDEIFKRSYMVLYGKNNR